MDWKKRLKYDKNSKAFTNRTFGLVVPASTGGQSGMVRASCCCSMASGDLSRLYICYVVSAEMTPEEVVRNEPEELDTEDHIWCWQEEFKPVVSKLALAIFETIQTQTRTALQKEMQEYEKSHLNYEAVDITGLLFCKITILKKVLFRGKRFVSPPCLLWC